MGFVVVISGGRRRGVELNTAICIEGQALLMAFLLLIERFWRRFSDHQTAHRK